MLLCYSNNHIKNATKYVDEIEQKALSRRVKLKRPQRHHVAQSAGKWFIDLDSTLALHRLAAAAANGGGSGDYSIANSGQPRRR